MRSRTAGISVPTLTLYPAIRFDDNNQADIKRTWTKFVSKLYTNDESSSFEYNVDMHITGTLVSKDEVDNAANSLRLKKSQE